MAQDPAATTSIRKQYCCWDERRRFSHRRSKFLGELALILEDLFSLAVEEQKGSSGNGLQDRCSCRSLLLR